MIFDELPLNARFRFLSEITIPYSGMAIGPWVKLTATQYVQEERPGRYGLLSVITPHVEIIPEGQLEAIEKLLVGGISIRAVAALSLNTMAALYHDYYRMWIESKSSDDPDYYDLNYALMGARSAMVVYAAARSRGTVPESGSQKSPFEIFCGCYEYLDIGDAEKDAAHMKQWLEDQGINAIEV